MLPEINTYKLMKGYCQHDKNSIRVPRRSSFMIMHTFADWGRVRHNMMESLGITTVQTTKMTGSGMRAKVLGGFLSSKGILTDGTYIKVFTLLRLICNWISRSFYIPVLECHKKTFVCATKY